MASYALFRLALASEPALAVVAEPTGPPVPSQVIKGTCPDGCAVDVPATNVTGPSVVCRLTEEDPPHQVHILIPYSFTRTEVKCEFFDGSGGESYDPGPYDLSLTNDGGGTHGSSVPLLLQCPSGTFSSHCYSCYCFYSEYCSQGWDGDGYCTQCPVGYFDVYCAEACSCNNGGACDMATGACFACDDSVDNDGDGLVDYPADPGCSSPSSNTESPQCNDSVDNDGNGLVDMADPDCTAPCDGREGPPVWCGLGAELALLVPLLELARRHRRRRRA